MARNTESDGTYCSEIEKEDHNQIRRSKRLSQRNLSSFRLNGDPIQRLYKIYQNIKVDDLCSKWLIDDWKSLKFEVELIQKTLKGKQKGRIAFILKKINKNLEKSSATSPNEPPSAIIESNQNDEQVESPNILAGMMTEILTEIPPYQPKNLPQIINMVKSPVPINVLIQKNPLDLTRKNMLLNEVPQEVPSQNISERQKSTRTPIIAAPFELQISTLNNPLSISKDSMIDLTDENAVETNQGNITPIMKERVSRTKSPVHVSKWLQFLPTQQRPKLTEKQSIAKTTSTIAPRKHSKSLKDSIVKLYRDQPTSSTSISNTIQKPFSTSNGPRRPKSIQQSKSSAITSQTNEKIIKKPFRNTENIIIRDSDPPRITPRNVQTENFCNISPDFLFEELELSESDINDSASSLTPSMKENLRKVFGTDELKDVFGVAVNEVVYNLKENHVRRLATALKIEHDTLKKTIENILSNDNYGLVEDDNMQSDSSVVECSQSPPQRLFPSQRSQT